MLKIVNKNLDLNNIKKTDFEKTEGAIFDEALYVKKESIIVVTEVLNGILFTRIFDANSLVQIPTSIRYATFHGQEEVEIKEGCRLITRIVVDQDTGNESLEKLVSKSGDILYKSGAQRYNDREHKPLWDSYLASIKSKNDQETRYKEAMDSFYSSSYEDKVIFLKTEFNKSRRMRWEMGFEPIEQVYSKKQLEDYDKDPDFRKVLKDILVGEEPIMGISEKDLFNSVLEPLYS